MQINFFIGEFFILFDKCNSIGEILWDFNRKCISSNRNRNICILQHSTLNSKDIPTFLVTLWWH